MPSAAVRPDRDIALGQKLVFVVSQPRAGSTLLQRILAGSPSIRTTAEPWIMLHPIYAMKATGLEAEYGAHLARTALEDYLDNVANGPEAFREAVRAWAMALYDFEVNDLSRSYFLDKTPRYYLVLTELKEVFPLAKFILLIRNPLAVLHSILTTWVKPDWSRLARFCDDLIRAPQILADAMADEDPRTCVVHYEDLVLDAHSVIESICVFLGVPFEEQMVHYGLRPPPLGKMGDSIGIARHMEPVSDSIDKWKVMANDEQMAHFARSYLEALGENLVSRLGYSMVEHSELLGTMTKPSLRLVPWNLAMIPESERTFREKLRIEWSMGTQREGVTRGSVVAARRAIGEVRRFLQ